MLSKSLALALAFAALAMPAHAITLTNRDTVDQKLTIIEGDKQTEQTVKAGDKVELCTQGCVIRMPDAESYEFDGKEVVSLEEGLLFLDAVEEAAKQVP
jgi:hypothetical protein